jgi:hypothetical protein
MNSDLEKIDKNLKFLSKYTGPFTPSLKASSDRIVSKIKKSRRNFLFEKWSTFIGVVLLVIGVIILFFNKEEIRLSFLYFSRLMALLVNIKLYNIF